MFAENKRHKKSKTLKMKRKVLFRKWIPIQYLKSENGRQERVEGTGVLQADYETKGIFHGFGFSIEEDERGFTNYSVAIVEDEEGFVHEILPSNMKFVVEKSEIKSSFVGQKDEDGNEVREGDLVKVGGLVEVVKYIDGVLCCYSPEIYGEIDFLNVSNEDHQNAVVTD